MKSNNEVRKDNLNLLIEQYGTIAKLNEVLGRKRTDATLSQIRQGLISTTTKRPRVMGDKLARQIEEKLRLGHGWMDNDHSGIATNEEKEKSDAIVVPVLENYGSMGDEPNFSEQDNVLGKMELSPEFVRRLRPSNAFNLRVITGRGDSMRPTIESGDRVLVDEGDKDLRDGVYVLRTQGSLFIKRVTRTLSGGITISSDNPNVKLSEQLNGSEEVEVVGRVIYAWKGTHI